jgi:hypothetical protein
MKNSSNSHSLLNFVLLDLKGIFALAPMIGGLDDDPNNPNGNGINGISGMNNGLNGMNNGLNGMNSSTASSPTVNMDGTSSPVPENNGRSSGGFFGNLIGGIFSGPKTGAFSGNANANSARNSANAVNPNAQFTFAARAIRQLSQWQKQMQKSRRVCLEDLEKQIAEVTKEAAECTLRFKIPSDMIQFQTYI